MWHCSTFHVSGEARGEISLHLQKGDGGVLDPQMGWLSLTGMVSRGLNPPPKPEPHFLPFTSLYINIQVYDTFEHSF